MLQPVTSNSEREIHSAPKATLTLGQLGVNLIVDEARLMLFCDVLCCTLTSPRESGIECKMVEPWIWHMV